MRHAILAFGMLSVLAAALPAHATIIDSTTLATIPAGSGSYTYTALDPQNTSLTVQQTPGASMNPISGTWPGLWLGSQEESGNYAFTFSQAVSSVQFYITAQSTDLGGAFSEIFSAFTTSAASTATFVSESGTAWDGSTLTSTVSDGRSYITFTSVGAAGFTSISFDHIQAGSPAGSVIQQIDYTISAVPEPATIALLLAGLAGVGLATRRSGVR